MKSSVINVAGKSIGVYWKKETLQIIKRAKHPTETFGECCNRIISECMSHAGMDIPIKVTSECKDMLNNIKKVGETYSEVIIRICKKYNKKE